MGAEFKDEPKQSARVERDTTPKTFGDPKDYEHLSMEERKALTEKMKSSFKSIDALKRWSQEKIDGR